MKKHILIALGVLSVLLCFGWIGPGQFPTNPAAPTGTTALLNVDGGLQWGNAGTAVSPGANGTVYESDGGVAYFGTVATSSLVPGAAGTELVSDGGLAFFSACGGDVTCSASNPALKTIVSISGTSPVTVFPNNLVWAASANGIKLSETQAASGAGNPAELFSQESATGSAAAGGDIRLTLGNGDGSANLQGKVRIRRDEGGGTVVDTETIGLDSNNGSTVEFINASSAPNWTRLIGNHVAIAAAAGVAGASITFDVGDNGLTWGSASQSIAAGGTITLGSAVYRYPVTVLTGTLPNNTTLVYPTGTSYVEWKVDATAVTFAAHTIQLSINSNVWGTTISAAGVWDVVYNGTKFYGFALTP